MHKVGDTKKFVPTAYAGQSNGSETAKDAIKRCTVEGMVTDVNVRHRWYRVAWKPQYDREQHECFKF